MKILSKDGQEYNSVKECLAADAAYDKKVADEKAKAEAERAAKELKLANEKAAISKKKKEMSDAIEDASKKHDEALKLYDAAKQRAAEILKEARTKANEIVSEAAKDVESASADRMNAIAAFNKEFGVYRTTLTEAQVADEYNRIVRSVNDVFSIWNNWPFRF